MRTILLTSLRVHTRRYVAAAIAVIIGVAFIVVTDALASATRNGLVAGVEQPYRNADVVVSDIDGEAATRLVADAAERGDRAAVLGSIILPVRTEDRQVDEGGDVGALAPDPALRWQELREGRFPTGPGEAVADVNAAKSDRIGIGDVLTVGSGSHAVSVTVVGLVDTPSAVVGDGLYLTWTDAERWASSLYVDSVAYDGRGDVDATIRDLRNETGGTVQTRDAFVEEVQTEITNEVNVLAMVLLVFAAVALFVSVLVIANTFSILFAQRARDLALLRCVGATRRQLLRSIRLEAVCLGVAASLVGLLVGTGLGLGLVTLARSAMPPGTMGATSPSGAWYAVGFAVGVLVTVVAAWLPTRRVVRVSPLAALRPDTGVDVRTTSGRARTGGGVVLVAGGIALLGASIAAHSAQLMVAGGAAAFGGVLLLGPLIVPALIRFAGWLSAGVLGPAGRLAAANAVRHPRRTAATTASLLVGVTLTTAVLTGLASSRGAVADDMDVSHPVDAVLTSTGAALPETLLPDVRAVAGVAEAVQLDGVTADVGQGLGEVQLVAAHGATGLVHGSHNVATPEPGVIHVPWELMPDASPTLVTVTVAGRSERLRVVGGEGWGSAAVVAPVTLASLTSDASPRAIWVRAAEGTDPEDLGGDLDALSSRRRRRGGQRPCRARMGGTAARRAHRGGRRPPRDRGRDRPGRDRQHPRPVGSRAGTGERSPSRPRPHPPPAAQDAGGRGRAVSRSSRRCWAP